MELISAFLPFIVLFAIMYFMLIRPQKKQQEKKQDMINNMKPGDHIVTIGGLHGVVDEVVDANQTVVVDCEGIYLTFEKVAIGRVVEGGTVQPSPAVVEEAAQIAEEANEAAIEDEEETFD